MGNKFYANLSKDLAEALPNVKSFSETNLKYIKYFYQLYSQISPQLVDELCKIPWGHHRYIIDKCKDKPEKQFELDIEAFLISAEGGYTKGNGTYNLKLGFIFG